MSKSPSKPQGMSKATKPSTALRAEQVVSGGMALGEATGERLINAAGEVFAEVGFRDATVRDICARANVNVAAVNYYFGDKASLYGEVLRHSHATARAKYPIEFTPAMSGEAALRGFVRTFMTKILDEGRPAWHGKLMAREMVEPTRALDEIVASTIRPTWNTLTGIVAKLLGRESIDLLVEDCAASIIGQCLLFCHCRPVIDRLYPQSRYTPEQIARLSDHIVRFSLAAMKAADVLGAPIGREPTPQPSPSGRGSKNGGRT